MFPCAACDLRFPSDTERDQHHYAVHDLLYDCPWHCGSQFVTWKLVDQHSRSLPLLHLNPHLTAHYRRIDEDGRPYFWCDTCQRSFRDMDALESHLLNSSRHIEEIAMLPHEYGLEDAASPGTDEVDMADSSSVLSEEYDSSAASTTSSSGDETDSDDPAPCAGTMQERLDNMTSVLMALLADRDAKSQLANQLASEMVALKTANTQYQEQIKALDAALEREKSARQCGICYDRDVDIVVNCGHMFCKPCITSWQRQRDRSVTIRRCPCPMCRQPMGVCRRARLTSS